ncbi:DNA glycosylase AlkZ-like family protein, partial [Kineococcus glutinatus]|uniref:DNA glycosylase AlkZ-like family protein n=1 Tax=Kineococcus glutinatus TaxID=1070872 RepID=UPI0031EDCE6E
LDDATCERARQPALAALAGRARLRREELLAAWQAAGLDVGGGRGYHLLHHLAVTGDVCLGPLAGAEQLVVAAATWIPRPRRLEREEALAELALRYARSHGPATAADLARWAGLPVGDARAALALAAGQLERVRVDGVEHHLDPRTPQLLAEHRAEAAGVLLLPGFDELLLGYADRSATLDAAFAPLVVPGGNGVFRATVLAGGRVVGT